LQLVLAIRSGNELLPLLLANLFFPFPLDLEEAALADDGQKPSKAIKLLSFSQLLTSFPLAD
jgi:hypothetical protein